MKTGVAMIKLKIIIVLVSVVIVGFHANAESLGDPIPSLKLDVRLEPKFSDSGTALIGFSAMIENTSYDDSLIVRTHRQRVIDFRIKALQGTNEVVPISLASAINPSKPLEPHYDTKIPPRGLLELEVALPEPRDKSEYKESITTGKPYSVRVFVALKYGSSSDALDGRFKKVFEFDEIEMLEFDSSFGVGR